MAPKTERFELRLEPKMIKRIDDWRRQQSDLPPRAEAMRRLVELGLPAAHPARRRGKKIGPKASEMAGRAIDRVEDRSVPAEDRARRKRRLLKGPQEFREMRGDLPKTKG
jgi:hypothetical protein